MELEVQRNDKVLTVRGTFSPDPPHSLAVHPTQVYLALAGWVLLPLTWYGLRHRRHYGMAFVLLMLGYSASRFAIELFRDDEPIQADGLTISQNISIVIFVGGIVLWGFLRRLPPCDDAKPTENEHRGNAALEAGGGRESAGGPMLTTPCG